MPISKLEQGQKIDAIFTPQTQDGEQSGAAIGFDQVTEIVIDQCAGPMGWYEVAVIKRGGVERPDEIVPVHMAEYIRLTPST